MSGDFQSLIDGVADSTTEALTHAGRKRQFDVGEDLIRIGEDVSLLFRILSGRAKAWRPLTDGQALTLTYLSTDTLPGLITCCNGHPSPTTITAVLPVEVDSWPAATIRKLLKEDAVFARNAFGMVSDLTLVLIDKLEDATGSAERRIGRALLNLASERGEWRDENSAVIVVSRQDLADMTGATLFTASRTLSDWQRRGLVRSSRGKVVLTDPQGIAAIAELVT